LELETSMSTMGCQRRKLAHYKDNKVRRTVNARRKKMDRLLRLGETITDEQTTILGRLKKFFGVE